jgi:hypothetical protein
MTRQQKGFKGMEQGALHELLGGWVWMKLVNIHILLYSPSLTVATLS